VCKRERGWKIPWRRLYFVERFPLSQSTSTMSSSPVDIVGARANGESRFPSHQPASPSFADVCLGLISVGDVLFSWRFQSSNGPTIRTFSPARGWPKRLGYRRPGFRCGSPTEGPSGGARKNCATKNANPQPVAAIAVASAATAVRHRHQDRDRSSTSRRHRRSPSRPPLSAEGGP